jgi:hypothetical protein
MEGFDEKLEEDVTSKESSEPDVVKGICSLLRSVPGIESQQSTGLMD